VSRFIDNNNCGEITAGNTTVDLMIGIVYVVCRARRASFRFGVEDRSSSLLIASNFLL